jgi:hypothetical protein
MSDFTHTLEAKSDQLNAVDIMGAELVIKIRDAKVTSGDQPLSVFFDGDNNKPWKPSKGMRRALASAWGGAKTENLIGKHARLYFDPTVKNKGVESGGIRIKALSDIPKNGIVVVERLNRTQSRTLNIAYLEVTQSAYPDDKFNATLSAMVEAMHSGKMTLQQIVAQCQKTGVLTPEQLKQLEDNAPVETGTEEDEFEL